MRTLELDPFLFAITGRRVAAPPGRSRSAAGWVASPAASDDSPPPAMECPRPDLVCTFPAEKTELRINDFDKFGSCRIVAGARDKL
jgi:hypothetical protein